ncbi:MAG: hypothetical protein KTR25_09590, partial [Myxococcales bacterium]|nr:hypothetical protein [Myxococcales bacterium]
LYPTKLELHAVNVYRGPYPPLIPPRMGGPADIYLPSAGIYLTKAFTERPNINRERLAGYA